jgi:two-component system, NtrC family, response regulator GlrR
MVEEAPSIGTLTWATAGATADAFPVVRLTVIGGPETGRSFDVEGDRAAVGTHRSAAVVLTDRTVSRFHCELIRQHGTLSVRDLESRNGTILDGVYVRDALARPGSRLALGSTVLRIDVGPTTRPAAAGGPGHFGDMAADSPAMRRVLAQLERAAASDATVLLLGETGTGKEVAAESVHRQSRRADGPFIVVDCGAIPGELLESELFGHERGAFTGAVRARDGAFQAASGGTIFLDEIGEMPRLLQPKLLRALARRAVKPVGRETYTDVDVRVIAATNRDLRHEVNTEQFRGDLFYRLAVVEVRLPPLRERLEDIHLLVDRFLSELDASPEERARLTSPSFLATLTSHRWPGNVRELRNNVERALAMGDQPFLDDTVAPPTSAAAPDTVPIDLARRFKEAREAWTNRFERAYLTALLDHHAGNIRAAAQASAIDRVHLYRLLGKHGLR